MNISRTTSRVPVQTTYTKSSNAIKQDSFGDVLKKSSAKDTFSVSSVSNKSVNGNSLSAAYTQEKLDKILDEIKNTDYSDMSKTEIRADIEGKYANAFEDFYATFAIHTCTDYIMIHDHFFNSLYDITGRNWTFDDINEARGYSGMNYDEIESAIREKYSDKTSFIDQLNFFGELFSSGILDNKFGWYMTTNLVSNLNFSLECGGDIAIDKNEWLSRIEQTGASSPFSLLLNNPYLSNYKEMFQSMVDYILFGVTDKAEDK